jgi:superfamily II DNA or RNA helicase
MQLYEYQREAVNQAKEILQQHGIVYLAMGMRTGKTITSLTIASELNCRHVLVLCSNENVKKTFTSTCLRINESITLYLSSHHPTTIEKFSSYIFDCIIVDEAHNFKAFPRTNQRQKALRNIVLNNRKRGNNPYIILLSGTPTPESYSDLFHQLWSVGKETHKNFYAFAHEFVNVKEKRVNATQIINDYSDCSEEYMKRLEHLFVVVSQEEAGILTQKRFRMIKTNNYITELINELIKTKTLTIANNVIFADNNSREMQIIRQLCGGVVYKDDKSFIEISTIKIETLKELFKQYHKTLIYYYYQAEREMLLKYLKEIVTENLDEAKSTDKHFIAQMTSIREGITFPECDAIIYYNVDFSAITFLQSQERASLQSKDAVDIVYLCSSDFPGKKLSFEEMVLNVLRKKKRFTDTIYGNIKNGTLHPYQLFGISG